MVHTETYTFTYFHLQYFVLFTMVPRNNMYVSPVLPPHYYLPVSLNHRLIYLYASRPGSLVAPPTNAVHS